MSVSHHDREEETLIAYFQQMLADVDDQEFDGELQAQGGDLYATPAHKSAYSVEANKQVLSSANEAIKHTHDESPYYQVPPTKSASKDNVSSSYSQDNYQEYSSKTKDSASANDLGSGANNVTSIESKVSPIEQDYTPEPQMQLAPQAKVAEKTLDFASPNDSGSLQRLLATVETHTETETKVETKAEPKLETKVETKVETKAEPKVDVKVEQPKLETKVEPKVEVKVEQPKVEPKVETKVEQPKVETKVAAPAPAVAPTVAAAPAAAAPAAAAPALKSAPVVASTKQAAKAVIKTPQQLAQERMAKKLEAIAAEWKNVDLGEQFQVLFFLVQGVRFAVPLIDLGGIFECEKITQLFGKPSWFMGITDVRGDKINIVDTLRWVMPEIKDSPDKYPYLISLGNTDWSIGCDILEGNRTLNKSQIKWREIPGNRPWLAGIVTSDKCAVLHVQSLIALFEAGADIEDLNKNLKTDKK